MAHRTTRLQSLPLPPGAPAPMPPPAPPPPPRPSFFATAAQTAALRAGGGAAHPLMAPMYWACADLLGMVPSLAASRGALPMPAELRGILDQQLSMMMGRARSAGIVPEDIVDAQFAIVALIDEQLARVHGWPGQAEWRTKPLQLVRFNENTAGESFFRRLAALEAQPHRVHVLQVYLLCMAVGFQGRYAVAGGEGLAPIYERVGARVAHAAGPDHISPHGEPRDGRSLLQFEAPLVRLGLGFFAVALLVFVVLRVILSMQVREVTRPMHDYANAAGVTEPQGKR